MVQMHDKYLGWIYSGHISLGDWPHVDNFFKGPVGMVAVSYTHLDVYKRQLVEETVDGQVDAIAGGETAGIPYAAFLSWKMGLPMLYVRKKPKGFGKNAMVEGNVVDGSRVILVEDLIFDGGSKVNFIEGLRRAGLVANHVFTIASYALHEEYERTLGSIGVKVSWLTDWPTIVDVAEYTGYFSKDAASTVREFLTGPHKWSRARGGK